MAEVVRGEASESEEEIHIKRKNIFASEVPGEATESDEDLYEKSVADLPNDYHFAESRCRNDLLQRKLIENNVAIYEGTSTFVKRFITNASKQLLNTDQLLMKSQVTMQSVLCSLKNSKVYIKQLNEKTSNVFTTNFLPDINL